MTFKSLMPEELLTALKSKFNIVGQVEFKQFDQNWDFLTDLLQSTRKKSFNINDRYIIEHQDTDIYIPEYPIGVNFRNLFEVIRKNDIPFYTILIWTNHIGIQKEVDIMCRRQHPDDRPTVIESFCTSTHTADCYLDTPMTIEQIQYHAVSLMGASRSHRYALHNSLKHIDANKLAMAIKGTST